MDEHTSKDDERERMLRLKAGDPEAFSELFAKHQPRITSYVYRLTSGNVAQAEDIAQQVFLSFWLHRSEYDLDKPLTPLLLTMARNAWVNAAKRDTLRKSHLIEKTAESKGASDRDTTGEHRELSAVLEQALSDMDAPLREVFVLSRHQELKYGEIANLLGISIKTVEARLSRALHFLHDRLKDFI